jgi:surfeit locus 1 family protein
MHKQFPYALGAIQVQALPESGAPPFPMRLELPETDDGPHLGYAIQWFSFAAIGLIGWLVLVIRRGEVTLPGNLSSK